MKTQSVCVRVFGCMDLSPCHPPFLLTVGPGWMTPLQPGQPQRPHCAPQPSVIIHHILTWQPTAQPPNPAKDGGLGYHDESTTGFPASDLCRTRAEGTFKFWNRSPLLHSQTKDLPGHSQKYLRDSFTSDVAEVFSILSLKENIIVKNPFHHVLHEPRIAVVCQ